MMRRPVIGAAICAATIISLGGTAFAGEITGNGEPTPIKQHRAASICSFSGLEDGWTLDEDENEVPTEHEGPGWVQTPHFENSPGVIFPPGVAGQACRGGGPKGD